MRFLSTRSVLLASCLALATAASARAQIWDPDPSWAQPDAAYRAVFAELGGAGYVYTLNGQFRVSRVWLRLGGGIIADEDGDVFWGLPFVASTLFGQGPHFLEAGAGVVLADLNDPAPLLDGLADIGYRFVHPTTGLTARATLTPHFGLDFQWWAPWAGISLGYTF